MELTATELLHEVSRAEAAHIAAAEAAQEADARPQRVERGRDERAKRVGVAVEEDRDERAARRGELVDDVHAVCPARERPGQGDGGDGTHSTS